MQLVQAIAAAAEYAPAGQDVQLVDAVAPVEARYLPAVQLVQLDDITIEENAPLAQLEQTLAPEDEYFPATQFEQPEEAERPVEAE